MSNPNNYGRIENADSIGIGENPQNGEKVIIYIEAAKEKDDFLIKNIAFEAIACMTTVVAGSIITNEAKNITFNKAKELIAVTLAMIENVPPEQAACTEIVTAALQAAMDGFKRSLEIGKKETLIYKIEQSCDPNQQFNMKDSNEESISKNS
ncbi:MAG: iron-sulfur cluster assembly scaffold protein [Epsilonproteobacteria bacterium]|nr:iron-sulfur cluster assembly scaffold protein [Campylobacterota bacterium]